MAPFILVIPDVNQRTIEAEKLLNKFNLTQNHPNLMWLGIGEKLGIEQAKKIQEHLSLKPFQAGGQSVVLLEAENLTPEAQNSLLKTFEELPENSVVIMSTSTTDQLLPTLVSRSQIQTFQSEEIRKLDDKVREKINKLISSPMSERFKIIEKLEDTGQFLQDLNHYFREQLLKNPNLQNQTFSQELIQAQKWANQNVNARAVLEYLMFKLPLDL